MGDYTPVRPENEVTTYTASAAVIGGQLLVFTGDNAVAPSAAGGLKAAGVAAHDAASGQRLTVYDLDALHETTVDTLGTMAAGDPVAAGANGTIAKDGAVAILHTIGICVVGAAAGAKARWMGF
jgi:hypothetical protein